MSLLFHVSPAANRASILAHGLDWTRMGAARGIAGSSVPEEEGVFLCRDEFEAGFFRRFDAAGSADLWAVTGIEPGDLLEAGSGFCYYPGRIPPEQVSLVSWPDPAVPAN